MLIKSNFIKKVNYVIFMKSWWVLVVILVAGFGFNIAVKKRNVAICEMMDKYSSLKKEKEIMISQRDDLKLKSLSQSDPAWIEMVLMKELGVVPENKIKVHFKN